MEFRTIPLGPLQANCYVLWKDPDRALVIDPGDEPDRLVEILRSWNVRPRLVFNTHGHFDHIGAVAALQREFGASYRIHSADVPIMAMVPARTRLWGILTPEAPTPDAFLADRERFDEAGVKVEAVHTPGHTPGSTCFFVPEEKMVITGDTLFAGSIGRSDFPGGDHAQLLDSIRRRLLSLPPELRVFPGHGPASTIAREAEENPFLS